MNAGFWGPRAGRLSARPHPERGGLTSPDANPRPHGNSPFPKLRRAPHFPGGRGLRGGAQVARTRPAGGAGGPRGRGAGQTPRARPRGSRPVARLGSPRFSPRPAPPSLSAPPRAPAARLSITAQPASRLHRKSGGKRRPRLPARRPRRARWARVGEGDLGIGARAGPGSACRGAPGGGAAEARAARGAACAGRGSLPPRPRLQPRRPRSRRWAPVRYSPAKSYKLRPN